MNCPARKINCDGYVKKLREDDYPQLVKFCKLHLATVVEMDKEQFEELFLPQSSQSNFKPNLSSIFPKRKGPGKNDEKRVFSAHI